MAFSSFSSVQQGFSLVELMASMVILAMGMVLATTALYPQFSASVDPMYRVRAIELGQSYLEEILAMRYDELSPEGALERCGEGATPVCTAVASLGPDAGENRANFDDVDDFHGLDSDLSGGPLWASGAVRDEFNRYRVVVTVNYDGNYDGSSDSDDSAKLIQLQITDPRGDLYRLAAYRSNF